MNPPELEPRLLRLGLSSDEGAAYVALLRHPGSAADDLANLSGIAASTIAQALGSLEAAGLVEREQDGRHFLVPPDLAFEFAMLEQARQLREIRELVHTLTAVHYNHATASRSREDGVVEVVSDPDAAIARWREAHASAHVQIRAAEVPPYGTAQTEVNPIEAELLGRGVPHRVLYDTSVAGLAHRFGELRDGIRSGEQARVLPGVPVRALIVDDRLALLPANSGRKLSEGLLLIRQGSLLHALSSLFEVLWERAVPLRFTTAATNDEDLDRQILKLLAVGLSDQTVARQLNLSQRTVQRHVASLMIRLGARTRLQAGVQGVRQGWV